MTTASALPCPSRTSLLRAAFAMSATLILAFIYLLFTEANTGTPCYAVYGIAWIIIGPWVLFDTDMASALTVTKRKAAVVAIGYFVLLVVAGGLVTSPVPGGASGIRVAFLPPG